MLTSHPVRPFRAVPHALKLTRSRDKVLTPRHLDGIETTITFPRSPPTGCHEASPGVEIPDRSRMRGFYP
jgi:hypothetical protein